MSRTLFNPKWVIGRKIVEVRMNPFPSGKGLKTAYDPEIVLDNGAEIRFVTEETEVGDYGTCLCYRRPPKTAKPPRAD